MPSRLQPQRVTELVDEDQQHEERREAPAPEQRVRPDRDDHRQRGVTKPNFATAKIRNLSLSTHWNPNTAAAMIGPPMRRAQ